MRAQKAPEPTGTQELDPAIGTLLREAAQYDLAAEGATRRQSVVEREIDGIREQMLPLEEALGEARGRLRDVGIEVETANSAALKQRTGAYDLGQMRGVTPAQMEAANQAAKAAAATEAATAAAAAAAQSQQPQNAPAEQVAWEPRLCRCNRPLAWYPSRNDGVHTDTGSRECNPGTGDGKYAEPVPIENALGQNGHMPSPEGAPR